jgi:hypothetical protein
MNSYFNKKGKGKRIYQTSSYEDASSDKENQKFDQNTRSRREDSKKNVIKGIKYLSSDQFLNDFDAIRFGTKETTLYHNSLRPGSRKVEESKSEIDDRELTQESTPLNQILSQIDSK